MSGCAKTVQNKEHIFTNKRIGFEWDVTPNYFSNNNCESDESDEVRLNKLLVIISLTNYLKHFFMNKLVQIAWLIVIRYNLQVLLITLVNIEN